MKTMRFLAAAAILAGGALAVRAVDLPAAAAQPLTIEQLVDIKHPSAPQWSPDGKRVLFVWDRAGVPAAYVSDLNGREPRLLAGLPATGLTWSSDSQAIQFTRNNQVWKAPIAGGQPSLVETPPSRPAGAAPEAPSPDSTRVAFVRSTAPAGRGAAEQPPSGRGGRGGRGGAGTSGPAELWIRAAAGGQEQRVAAMDAGIGNVAWSPDGGYLLFSSGGGAVRHEQTPDYSGTKIIYTVNENRPATSYAVAVPAAGMPGTPVELPAGGFGARRWLDATHYLADRTGLDFRFKKRETAVVDIATGKTDLVNEEVKQTFWSMTGDAGGGSQLSPDKKWLSFLSDRDGWDHLYVMPAPRPGQRAGTPVQITKGKFEAWRPVWSPDSTRIAFDANEPDKPGTRHIGVVTLNGDPARATIKMITSGRGTNIAPQWSPDGTRLVYQHTDPRNSADLFVVDAAGSAAAPVRLGDSMPKTIDRSTFVEPELVRYPGPDGKSVAAWLFVPKNLDRSRKHPAIVWIHGDGVNQGYDGWHVQRNYAVYYSFHQYLLQKGYVVIAPDYRGSIGYGSAWREGVHMDVGGHDAKDAWMVANHLKTLPYVDTERVGVWGLSYGGFFTLIAMTDQPKLFRAGVDVAGVVDYEMYYEDPFHGGWTESRIGKPADNPQVYAKASPLSHVDRLERPLLVLHGTSDVNVPYLHSVRLIDEALKKGKGDLVEFMTYPGEFHYFTREHVLKDAWHRVERFFDEHLRSADPARTSAPSGARRD